MQFFGGSSLTSIAPESSPAPVAPPAMGMGSNAQVIYVFNRNGVCLLYCEWHRPLRTLTRNQDRKLMFGLLFSLRSFTAKIDPTSTEHANLGAALLPGQGCSFHSFKTNTYKLNYMESPSGIKLILLTHPRTGDQRDALKHIYSLYVEYVVKNPLYAPGSPIKFGRRCVLNSGEQLHLNVFGNSEPWNSLVCGGISVLFDLIQSLSFEKLLLQG